MKDPKSSEVLSPMINTNFQTVIIAELSRA